MVLEERAEGDDPVDALGQLPGNPLHQRDHAVVAVVVARDDPDHPQSVHHRRQSVDHLHNRQSWKVDTAS